ncbi:erythromycin esterase family protein [Spirillospora sp. NPDC127200]
MTVTDWITRTRHPLATADPAAPLDDLKPLLGMVGGASVVGVGAGTRGARELAALQLRVVELLVGEAGFRAVALDADWGWAIGLDRYVRTGAGDPRALLAATEAVWQVEEVFALVEWLRSFNVKHPGDPVRLLGVSVGDVGEPAYRAVLDHVREAAPDRAAEVAEHYAALRAGEPARAEAVHALVAGLPEHEGRAWAVQNARVIAASQEHRAHRTPADPTNMAALERGFAANLLWWHRTVTPKILFWSATTHAANGPERTVRFPPTRHPPGPQRNAGSILREALGDAYASIALTFHDGELNTYRDGPPFRVVPAAPELVEATLGTDAYLLDLRAPAPAAVTAWLNRPARTRVIGPRYDPADDGGHHMSGGSPADWFDVIAHWPHVTPTRRIAPKD